MCLQSEWCNNKCALNSHLLFIVNTPIKGQEQFALPKKYLCCSLISPLRDMSYSAILSLFLFFYLSLPPLYCLTWCIYCTLYLTCLFFFLPNIFGYISYSALSLRLLFLAAVSSSSSSLLLFICLCLTDENVISLFFAHRLLPV